MIIVRTCNFTIFDKIISITIINKLKVFSHYIKSNISLLLVIILFIINTKILSKI